LHSNNLAFEVPGLGEKTEEELMQLLGKPETVLVKRTDGQPNGPGVPDYQVHVPEWLYFEMFTTPPLIKIVDFGQAFPMEAPPIRVQTPIIVQAPELTFNDTFDHRIDLWSIGCLVCFPPFLETLRVAKQTLVTPSLRFDTLTVSLSFSSSPRATP
jgi:serine/threonine protein kinase